MSGFYWETHKGKEWNTSMKKVLALMLALILVIGLFAGCAKAPSTDDSGSSAGTPSTGDTGSTGNTGNTGSTETPDDSGSDEPASVYPLCEPGAVELTFWYPLFSFITAYQSSYDENPIMIEMEKITGVHINWQHPSSEAAQEQYNLLFMSEDLPDLIKEMVVSYIGGIDQAIKDGYYIDMNQYVDSFPVYNELINQSKDYKAAVTTDEGHIRGFAYLRAANNRVVYGNGYRQDIFENLGITERPELISDWDSALDKMGAAGYKNFISLDNYGIPQGDFWISAWEASGTFINQNGKAVFGPTLPGFKDYLKKMNEWYEKGYIHEAVTNPEVNAWQMEETLVGTVADGFMGTSYVDNHAVENPDYYLACAHYPRAKEDMVVHTWHGGGNYFMHTTYVTTECEYPEIACRWADFWYTDEGWLMCNYGIEDTCYYFDEEGKPMLNDFMFNNPDGINVILMMFMYCFMGGIGVESTAPRFDQMPTVDYETIYLTDSKFGTGADDWNMPASISMTSDESTTYSQIMADINTYLEEYTAKCIMGEFDIDSTYDGFIDQIYQMRLEDAVVVYQQALDRYLARS